MTAWNIDFTTSARADVVGLEADANEALTDTLVAWLNDGPPRQNHRIMLDVEFYEAIVANRYLLAYAVDDVRRRFVVLWLRRRPGPSSTR